MSSPTILGIHHVTAITADAQRNIDFYSSVLGMRLVKLTVNFDDPTSYHLYYGDQRGSPGTLLTFFAWPGAALGRKGPPQATVISLAVPLGSMDYWSRRLQEKGVAIEQTLQRFNERAFSFLDPDGLRLELIGATSAGEPWKAGPVPVKQAIRGVHSVTLAEEGYERTARLLTQTMGFRHVGEEGNRFRFECGAGGAGSIVDIHCIPDSQHGRLGTGIVHHVAWRTPDDDQQKQWRERLAELAFNVSPIIDRTYFHSIYFREPGGVLLEIATDSPGMTLDEPEESLGTKLMLPAWVEPLRDTLENLLPPVNVPR